MFLPRIWAAASVRSGTHAALPPLDDSGTLSGLGGGLALASVSAARATVSLRRCSVTRCCVDRAEEDNAAAAPWSAIPPACDTGACKSIKAGTNLQV